MQLSSNLVLDTSCLIILSKIEELELLRGISNKVYVTPLIHSDNSFGIWSTPS
jgi:predicted nucleic acid-binding protein